MSIKVFDFPDYSSVSPPSRPRVSSDVGAFRRVLARASQTLLDVVVLSSALGLAFLLRFDWHPPREMVERYLLLLPYVVGLKYGVLYALGVPRFTWRYVSLREVIRILIGVAVASGILLALRLTLTAVYVIPPQTLIIPVGVIAIDFALAFLGVAGLRAARRITAEQVTRKSHESPDNPGIPTLLVGAGQCGLMVAKEIVSRPDLGLRPVAFVDDDAMQRGTVLHGISVLGSTDAIPEVVQRTFAKQALITIAGAPGATIRRITDSCELAGIPVKIIPGLYEVVGGQVNLSRIRDVAIEDLLRREPVQLADRAVAEYVRDRVVFVTGAGGSIGSELCRQICGYRPRRLVLIERAENNLFSVHQELTARYPDLAVVPVIADVCDEPRMRVQFREHNPHVVVHAAAHKHVPMMEWNPSEAVKNNVGGTVLVADLAVRFQVERFVLVSTDKAVNPASVMGAAKRLAEQYIQSLFEDGATRFVAVRFGNVLGSAGSVVPIFKEQIAKGGPVTVTHPEMRRYFMTIPEACQLVLQAASMGRGGEIFILDMGEPVLIADLAKDLIRLSGLQPEVDVELSFTGLRPGEKLFEELSIKAEDAEKTQHPKIFVGKLQPPSRKIRPEIDELLALADSVSADQIRAKLRALVPEYKPEPEHSFDASAPHAAISSQASSSGAPSGRRSTGMS